MFEKEAEDYYAGRPIEPYSDDDSPSDWANIAHYAEENLEKAFKCIAELEWQFKEIVKDNDYWQAENKRLEKENAELKSRDCWKACQFTDGKTELIHEILQQQYNLTKAKALLKWALHSDPEHDDDFDQKWEEAEDFIKG